MFTGIELSKEQIPIVIFWVFIVTLFCLLLSMSGYFFNPHGPELKKIKELFIQLGEFAENIGSKDAVSARNKVDIVLKETEEILISGYNSWRSSYIFNRLVLLYSHANMMFLEMIKVNIDTEEKLPEEIVKEIKKIPRAIKYKGNIDLKLEEINIKNQFEYEEVIDLLYYIESIINIEYKYLGSDISIHKPSTWNRLIKSFSKDSMTFVYSIRYGVVLAIAAIVSYKLRVMKAYWITLSCASVMFGKSISATFNRAIQRSIGTIIGIFLTFIILSIHPQGVMLVILNMVFTALIEIYIGQNYAIAAMFLTANSILIAENASQIYNTMYFASPRIENIVIGSFIGVVGTYIIGYKSASKRIHFLMAELLRSHGRALVYLNYNEEDNRKSIIKEKLDMDFDNLKTTYISALGEYSKDKEKFEMLWPAFFALEHMSYLLSQYCADKEKLDLNEEELAELLLTYVRMANDIEQQRNIKYREVDDIKQISELCKKGIIFI